MIERVRTYLIAIRNILIGGNLRSLQLIGSPRLLVDISSTLLFYYKTLTGRGRLEQENPDRVIGGSSKHEIRMDTDGFFWGSDPSYAKDIVTLSYVTRALKPKRIFEIGTLDGYTALHFAMNSDIETTVYTLDLPKDGSVKPSLKSTLVDVDHQVSHAQKARYRFEGTEFETQIHCLFGDSATFDYSRYYLDIDLFFIDGAHSYEYVKSDTLNALKCVRKGGVIFWHDYGRMGVNGVSKWLHELGRSKKVYSVPGSSLAFMVVG